MKTLEKRMKNHEKIMGAYLQYRVIALISVNIAQSLDMEGHELASVHLYPNEGQYSPISVQ